MLAKLDTVNWDELTHAYGPASDVPALLRGLASSRRRVREESLQSLYSNIWHQGTVYEATSVAVPFLGELVRAPRVRGRTAILGLLQAIASAYPSAETKLDPIWRERRSARDIAGRAEAARWARTAADAVSAESDTFVTLLKDPAPIVRCTAALTLTCCPAKFDNFETHLRRAIDDETSAAVKAALLYAWIKAWQKSGRGPQRIRNRLGRMVHDRSQHPVIRMMAAIGVLQFLAPGRYPRLTDFLARAYQKSTQALTSLGRVFSFDISDALAQQPECRLAFFRALVQTPGGANETCISGLEALCRERRSHFAKVVPVLGHLLTHGNAELREQAAWQLTQMGTWVRHARETLLQALDDANEEVALLAAVGLSKIREPRALPFLCRRLAPASHTDPPSVGANADVLETLLGQQSAGRHLHAVRLVVDALKAYGEAAVPALPHLRTLLTSRGTEIQKLVCPVLPGLGPTGFDTIAIVARLLRNPETQAPATWALLQWGPPAFLALNDISRFLRDFPEADSWAVANAMKTLGMFGPQARATLPILETRLGDANVVIKTAAAVAIWQIAPPAPQAIQALLEELHERTKPGWAIHGCSVVVEALERIGPAASSAAPSLEKLLDDPDPWSRVHAARALWKMRRDPALVVPVLTEDLLCQPVGIATGLLAAECLAEIGPAAAAAQPRIQELLAHEGSLANFGTGWVESDEAFQAALQHALHQINPTP